MGINPNIIVLAVRRAAGAVHFPSKISMFCNVKPDCVIENITLPCLYEAPLMLEKSNFSSVVCRELGIDAPAPELTEWEHMVERIKTADKHVTIGLVGKYVQLHDAYLSVAEALRHAGYALGAEVTIQWIDSETITEGNAGEILGALDGIIVPGGFGQRGINGMILAAKYAKRASGSLSSASALVCRSPSLNMPAMWPDALTRTPASSTRSARTRSSTSCPDRATRSTRAVRCGWALIPVSFSPAPPWSAATADRRSLSATATAMNSTTSTGMH